jgi:hypothetical protein
MNNPPEWRDKLNTGNSLEFKMSLYIVCQKKRNNPRMDVRICQKKCDLKDGCKEFAAHNSSETKELNVQIPVEQHGMQMGM